MKLCDTCIYRNNVEQLKPCIIYRDDCKLYERGDMSNEDAVNIIKKGLDNNSIDCFDIKQYMAIDMAIKALEQEPKYCDRNICVSNEYNGIGCDECEVTKSQEPKTGHWKKIQSGDKDFPESIVCSRCGHENSYLDFGISSVPIGKFFMKSKFCPHCGAKMVEPQESEVHCNFTDAEIAKSFIEDVEAVKNLLPQESDHKCHTCKHYTSGERDGSCGSYICKGYSNWESEE